MIVMRFLWIVFILFPIEQCVQRIIQRLKFPTPKGGGVVNVTYPFVFSNSGG